jgi:hypothetical protein
MANLAGIGGPQMFRRAVTNMTDSLSPEGSARLRCLNRNRLSNSLD